MVIGEQQRNKLDAKLAEVFEMVSGSATLTVIMVLERNASSEKPELLPNQFPSREEWRRAVIERQKNKLALEIGSTIEELKKLQLKVRGGTIFHLVVVEGTAENILKALELDGVRKAIYDHPLTIRRFPKAAGKE